MPDSSRSDRGPSAPEAVRRPAYDAQQQIKDLILTRGLGPGSPLPPEPELMAVLGISRSSLREAVKGLQSRGLVSVEHGRGSFVGRPTLDPFVDALIFHRAVAAPAEAFDTASDLVDIRDILETRLVQRVALTVTDEQLAALGEAVERMEASAAAGESFLEHDRQFHELLYASLGNHLVVQLVVAFWDVLDTVRPLLPPDTSDMVTDASLHRRILERVAARDPAGAAEAMREHFRGTHRQFESAGVAAPE